MGGSTLLLLLLPGGSGSGSGGPTVTQFIGPFGWSFFFQGGGVVPTGPTRPDPLRSTAARRGADPRRSTAVRA